MNEPVIAGQRLFFALWPSLEVQRRLSGVGRLALGHHAGKLVPPESVHVTLAFLGTVSGAQAAQAAEVAGQLEWQPLTVHFDRLGWFRRARVLWAGCSQTPEALVDYVGRLRVGLSRSGATADDRPFRAHATLVRKLRRPPVVHEMETVDCLFDGVRLVRSLLTDGGSRYELVQSWPAQPSSSFESEE